MKPKSKRRTKTEPAKIPAEPTRWSESSQRSYAVASKQFYEDMPWTCRGCGREDIFTAQEQKQAFEVDQVYIMKHPVLCDACRAKKQHLADSLPTYEARWRAHKQELRHDLAFLKNWLELLEAYAQVGGRRNRDVIQMLRKLIHAQPN